MDRKNKKNYVTQTLFLFLLTIFVVTGCGNKQNPPAETTVEQDGAEWVYVPELVDLEVKNARGKDMKMAGNVLYCKAGAYDAEAGRYTTVIWRYSLESGSADKVLISEERCSIEQYCPVQGGGMVVLFQNAPEEQNGDGSWYSLARYDGTGEEIYCHDLRGTLKEAAGGFRFDGIFADKEDKIYLATNNRIYFFDEAGKSKGFVEIDGMEKVGVGKDGKVYVCRRSLALGDGSCSLVEVNFGKKTLGDSYKNFPDSTGKVLYEGATMDFIVYDETAVYEYNLASKTSRRLFDWLDCDIDGSGVGNLFVMGDGRLLAAIDGWRGEGNCLVFFERMTAEEALQNRGPQEKEAAEIVVGILNGGTDVRKLQEAAVGFNKSQDDYRVTVWTYNDIVNLNSDLISNNCPDILSLSGLNVSALAAKGLFVDLSLYLEESSLLAREDYLDNILEGCTYGGSLLCIPESFDLDVVVGRASDVGTRMGWSLREMLDYVNAHPEAEVFDSMPRGYILRSCMRYNEESFIDWEHGTCNFDTPEFKELLQLLYRIPEEAQSAGPIKLQNGEVLLHLEFMMRSFENVQVWKEMFGGEITCIGFPTADGSSGCIMNLYGSYAITSGSDFKEGAWSFIEGYLAGLYGSQKYRMGELPTNRVELEAMLEDAVTEDYLLDENGQPLLDENGQPRVRRGTHRIKFDDGWEYTYRLSTREEAEVIMELIKSAKPALQVSDVVMNIISEEAGSYFAGDKSVDDVVDIIQRRMTVYVNENM